MSNSDKVPNIHGPITPQESSKNTPIDAEKFKRIHKVEESDETHKRHKRNLKKQEEGEEDEIAEPPLPKTGLFESLLSKSPAKDSIFEVTEPTALPSPEKLKKLTSFDESPTTSSLRTQDQADQFQKQVDQVSDQENGDFFFVNSDSGQPSQPSLSKQPPPLQNSPLPELGNEAQLQIQKPALSQGENPTAITPHKTDPKQLLKEATTLSKPLPTLPIEAAKVEKEAELLAIAQAKSKKKKESSPIKEPIPPQQKAPGAPPQKSKTQPTLQPKGSSLPFKDLDVISYATENLKLKPSEPSEKAPLVDQNLGTLNTKEKSITAHPSDQREKPQQEPSSDDHGKLPIREKIQREPTSTPEFKNSMPKQKDSHYPSVETPPEKRIESHLMPSSKPQESPQDQSFPQSDEHLAIQSNISSVTPKKMQLNPEESPPQELPYPLPPLEATHQKKKEARQESNKEVEPIYSPLIQPYLDLLPPPHPAEMPSYSRLTPEVFDIFQKMVGLLTIQKETGVTTTTIVINHPGSAFDSAELIVEHYDTAPHAFNVMLQGEAKAVDLFNENVTDLIAALEHSKLSYVVNIRRAIIAPQVKILQRKEDITKETKK